MKNNKQQAAADVLLKYLLPDALKPEYDGLTAYELAGKVLAAAETAEGIDSLCQNCGEREKVTGEYFCEHCLELEAKALNEQKGD